MLLLAKVGMLAHTRAAGRAPPADHAVARIVARAMGTDTAAPGETSAHESIIYPGVPAQRAHFWRPPNGQTPGRGHQPLAVLRCQRAQAHRIAADDMRHIGRAHQRHGSAAGPLTNTISSSATGSPPRPATAPCPAKMRPHRSAGGRPAKDAALESQMSGR